MTLLCRDLSHSWLYLLWCLSLRHTNARVWHVTDIFIKKCDVYDAGNGIAWFCYFEENIINIFLKNLQDVALLAHVLSVIRPPMFAQISWMPLSLIFSHSKNYFIPNNQQNLTIYNTQQYLTKHIHPKVPNQPWCIFISFIFLIILCRLDIRCLKMVLNSTFKGYVNIGRVTRG